VCSGGPGGEEWVLREPGGKKETSSEKKNRIEKCAKEKYRSGETLAVAVLRNEVLP